MHVLYADAHAEGDALQHKPGVVRRPQRNTCTIQVRQQRRGLFRLMKKDADSCGDPFRFASMVRPEFWIPFQLSSADTFVGLTVESNACLRMFLAARAAGHGNILPIRVRLIC